MTEYRTNYFCYRKNNSL